MNTNSKSSRSVKRLTKGLLILFFAMALIWPLPELLAGQSNPLGNSVLAAAAADPVIAAAGDIACDPTVSTYNGGSGTSNACRQKYTSNLLVNGGFAAVLSLGDNQYNCGGYTAFQQGYDPTWGRVKAITHPVVGNHEYLTSGGTGCTTANTGAAGYWQYFGSAAGTSGRTTAVFPAVHEAARTSRVKAIRGTG